MDVAALRGKSYKSTEEGLGQRGVRMGPEMGWAGRPGPADLGPFRPISRPPLLVMLPESSRVFSLLHVGP